VKELGEAVVGAIKRTADKPAMWVDRKKRWRASCRTIATSSSVTRNAGGSDARRNRGRRIGAANVSAPIPKL
jgi:hypothetical protein